MAITGFIVNNGSPVCVATSQQAMEVLASAFPVYGGSAPSMCILNSSVFSGVNTFTQNISCHDLTSNQFSTFSHPLTLMMCDPALGIGGLNVFDPVAGAAFFSFAMTFVFGSFLLARNSQIIIDAIKKF